MTLIVVGLIVLGVLEIVCLLALVDQYKGILQIRERLALDDTALDLEVVNAGVQAAAIGLPLAFSRDDLAVGVMLSTKCASCFTVAEGFKGRVPTGAWAIIAGSESGCKEFQERVGLAGDRVLMDFGGQIADRLHVRTFPSALLFANGQLTAVKSVPSYRELRHVLDDWRSGGHALNATGGQKDGDH